MEIAPEVQAKFDNRAKEQTEDQTILALGTACFLLFVGATIALIVFIANAQTSAKAVQDQGNSGIRLIQGVLPPVFAQLNQSIGLLETTATTQLNNIINAITQGVVNGTTVAVTVGNKILQAADDGFGTVISTIQDLANSDTQFFIQIVQPLEAIVLFAGNVLILVLSGFLLFSGFPLLVKVLTLLASLI